MGIDKPQVQNTQSPYYCNHCCNCFNMLKKKNTVRTRRVMKGLDFTAIFIRLT